MHALRRHQRLISQVLLGAWVLLWLLCAAWSCSRMLDRALTDSLDLRGTNAAASVFVTPSATADQSSAILTESCHQSTSQSQSQSPDHCQQTTTAVSLAGSLLPLMLFAAALISVLANLRLPHLLRPLRFWRRDTDFAIPIPPTKRYHRLHI